jgi:hypothetical protein
LYIYSYVYGIKIWLHPKLDIKKLTNLWIMRVVKYLIEKNIGLASIIYMCDYLHLDHVKINSKLSEAKISLFNATLDTQSFQDWLQIKINLDSIEINNAKKLIIPLFYNETFQIDELLGERILNGILLLINKSYYSNAKEGLLQILSADKSILEKISLLKLSEPFSKPKQASNPPKKTKISYSRDDSNYDPYENFRWGGLSGEEAFVGYWNTD